MKLIRPSNWQVSHLYYLFLSLHVIIKPELHMNSGYWGKTLIKLLNLTNSVFNNNDSETEKRGIRTTYWGGKAYWQDITWSHKPCEGKESHTDLWVTKALKAHWHASTQDTLLHVWRKHAKHLGTWARKHARHIGTWTRKHARHVST